MRLQRMFVLTSGQHQVGVNHIFGVPGDFNLTLLDHIYSISLPACLPSRMLTSF